MDRPQIKLIKTRLDVILESTTFIILAFLWVYVIISYKSLPEIIPAHYGMDGTVDRYDKKITVFLLPGILTIIVIGLRLLTRFAHKFNYLTPITKENAEKQYKLSTRMLRVINFIIAMAFSYIAIKEIYDSKQSQAVMSWWFIPALFVALIGTTGYFIWKGYKKF